MNFLVEVRAPATRVDAVVRDAVAAHALGHALVNGEALELWQPDDAYCVDVWRAGGA